MPTAAPTSALTLDVGGSHVTAARVSLAQRRVENEARRTLVHGEGLCSLLNDWAEAALEAAGDHSGPFSHIGLAVPGPFDLESGVSQMRHKFHALKGVPLRPLLAGYFAATPLAGLPILFGNDADLFALGEWWASRQRTAGESALDDRMIGLTLGTGLGSGFIAAGRVVTTGDTVPPGGELWNVPYRDTVAESFACGAAVTRAWTALGGRRPAGQESPSARDLAALASAGDERALETFRVFGTDLAGVLWPWVQRFAARRVVLGGNVSHAFSLFGPAVQAGLDSHAGLECQVMVSEYFERAGLLGAAALSPEAAPSATANRGEST